MRQNEFLGVVIDGSTNGATNGEFARVLVQMLVDWFVETAETITAGLIVNVLRQLRGSLSDRFQEGPLASSSSM
ncbi:hypothetical protein ILFOPFJJ_01849 [Ensifer psoraleae]|nr:hypothetical protein [Sinorhizobium psoraleae]